jgi:hypothetical protein
MFMSNHQHRWIAAPELGCGRYYCMCGAAGLRNATGRIVFEPNWQSRSDFETPDLVHQTGGRKPSLDYYDWKLQ